jgi:hypothetical protein
MHFVVMVWEVQFIEELILSITVIVVKFWGWEYREELIMIAPVFVEIVWEG